jgi:hypothetical protein
MNSNGGGKGSGLTISHCNTGDYWIVSPLLQPVISKAVSVKIL